MKQKITFILLTAFLLLSGQQAYAEVYSGVDGNISWSVDTETGVLTLSGSGTMKNYSKYYLTKAPWYSYKSSIKSVAISEGVTSIGDEAFRDCSSLRSVTMPESVTSIGNYAFWDCSSLTSVTIPDGVTSIGENAFSACSSLTSVTIPDGVMSIGGGAFSGCRSLTSVTIPDGVTSIGENAFSGCRSLASVTIPESVTSLGASAFRDCSSLTSVTIPDGVTSIGQFTFDGCSSLTSVTIPDGVTSIGDYAFRSCTSLTSVTIPDGVTSIGSCAFYGCSSLTSVTIPEGVTSIGGQAFYGCTGLTSVTIPEGVTSIRQFTFYHCSSLTSVTIPDGVTSIGDYAFEGCSSLRSVTIPDGVTSIGYEAFNGCSSLRSVTIPSTVTAIGSNAFENCSLLKFVLNNSSLIIQSGSTDNGYVAYYATMVVKGQDGDTFGEDNGFLFYESGGEKYIFDYVGISPHIIMPSGYEYVAGIFENRTDLLSVTLPSDMTSVPSRLFYGCQLMSLTVGSRVVSIGTNAFNKKPYKTIWLCNTPPSNYSLAQGSINYVANNQFSALSNVKVYSSLSSMFTVDGVKYVMVSPSDRTCVAVDCEYNANAAHIHIGETVTYKNVTLKVLDVNNYACYKNPYIEDVLLVNNGNVGGSAFYDCDSIQSVTISNNGNVIGSAFYDCDGIQSVTISNNGNINTYAFYDCDGIRSADIQNKGLIDECAFYSCDALQTVELGDDITSIGYDAFYYCTKLGSIVIPDATTSLGSYCFAGCTSLTSVTTGSGLQTIGSYAFRDCSSLSQVTLKEGVQTIGTYSFQNCSSLSEIAVPKSVTSIGNYAFSGCTALKDVTFADRTTALSLGSNGSNPMFSSCPLESVYIGGKITYSTSSSYGYSPFYRNTTLKSVTITDTETTIYPNEFYGCSALTDVSIGDGVTSIGNWAFSGCVSLTNFSFGRGMKTIGEEAFSDCTAMTTIVSQASVPPTCGSQALDDINKWECELFVPTGYADAYAAADQWKEFFFVEEKDVEETYSTILAAEYGTWIVPVDAEIPEGFTFYTCENFNGGSLELVEATSIEANVPYIIQGTAGDTCTVTGIYDMSDNLTYGCLTGVYEDTQVTSGYVLQDGEEGLGFYRVGSTAITLTANHCYLNVTGSSAPMFRLGDATGVDRMMVEEQDDVLYDLYGRKVNEPNGAGIYIKNGKKVFVK